MTSRNPGHAPGAHWHRYSWGPNCPDGRSFCPLSSSGQKKGCFGVVFGVFCVRTYPRKECVTAEERTGVGGGIVGKMRPYLGKARPIWAICTKSWQTCSRIGGENSIIRLFCHFSCKCHSYRYLLYQPCKLCVDRCEYAVV